MTNQVSERAFKPTEIEIDTNPRKENNPGFKPERMKELREDIRKYGLKQKPEVRIMADGKPRLIAGERRLRSICSLLETNALCYDYETKKVAPAKEVYKEIRCRITECLTDKDATRAAVMENLLHEHLTDFEILLQCRNLEESGHTRAEQAEVFDKSEAWVSQSHSLLDLIAAHPPLQTAIESGTLGRTQALQFLNVPKEKVEDVLKTALELSKLEWAKKKKVLDSEADKAVEELSDLDAQLLQAEESNDEETIAQLKDILKNKEAQVNEITEKVKKHRASGRRTPRPSMGDIDNAREKTGAGSTTRHMPMKQVKIIADELTKLLESEQPLVNTDTQKPYSRREVTIVRDTLNCVLSRNGMKNPIEALDVEEKEAAK